MRIRARKDNIHSDIVDALRAIGASVQDLSAVGRGVPDLLVGYRGVNYLIELKTPKHGTKQDTAQRQLEWHTSWRGVSHYAKSVNEVYKIIGVVTNE